MSTEHAQVGWGFWLRWVLATSVVPSVVTAMALVIGESVRGSDQQIIIAVFLGLAILASTVIAQWLVLRRQIARAGRWVLAGIVGLVVGSVVGLVAGGAVRLVALGFKGVLGADFTEAVGIIGGLGVGIGLGIPSALAAITIAQWLVLRRHVSRAGWWLLAHIVGLVVGSFVGAVLRGVLGVDADARAVVYSLPGLAAYGAITGGVMVWLLRQPAAKEIGPRQAAE